MSEADTIREDSIRRALALVAHIAPATAQLAERDLTALERRAEQAERARDEAVELPDRDALRARAEQAEAALRALKFHHHLDAVGQEIIDHTLAATTPGESPTCPTCGSDDPVKLKGMCQVPVVYGEAPDPFHAAHSSATPGEPDEEVFVQMPPVRTQRLTVYRWRGWLPRRGRAPTPGERHEFVGGSSTHCHRCGVGRSTHATPGELLPSYPSWWGEPQDHDGMHDGSPCRRCGARVLPAASTADLDRADHDGRTPEAVHEYENAEVPE